MRCSDFEKRLSAFLQGDLSSEERQAVLAHFETCVDCRQIAQMARGDFDLEPEAFVASVLERTSGTTCGHARPRLCELVDGVLAPEYSRLLASHLHHCRNCSALFVALIELAEVLPEMALLEPDRCFTEDVLAATVTLEEEVIESTNPALRFLETLFQRPRLSWEAAYLGTLLVMGIWAGLAQHPSDSAQFLASTQVYNNIIHQERILERTEELHQQIAEPYWTWRKVVDESASDIRRQASDLPSEFRTYLRSKTDWAADQVLSHLEELWEKLPLRDESLKE
jgi:anti-sigma factor RsiW